MYSKPPNFYTISHLMKCVFNFFHLLFIIADLWLGFTVEVEISADWIRIEKPVVRGRPKELNQ